MLIIDNEFKCSNCNYHLYKSNTVSEKIKGYNSVEQVINCNSCGAKYLVDGEKIIYYVKGKDLNARQGNKDNSPILAYAAIALVIIGIICFGINALVKTNNNDVAVLNKPNAIMASFNDVKITCDFNIARKKALLKLKEYGLSLVEDKFQPNKDLNTCEITYYLYIKKIKHDVNGKSYLEDKIYQCNLTYRIVAKEFQYMDGILMDLQSNRGQKIP